MFIPPELDAEIAVGALLFKFFFGNIDDDILKIIDENDLPFYGIWCKERTQVIFFHDGNIRFADILQAFAFSDCMNGPAKNLHTVQGIFNLFFVNG